MFILDVVETAINNHESSRKKLRGKVSSENINKRKLTHQATAWLLVSLLFLVLMLLVLCES